MAIIPVSSAGRRTFAFMTYALILANVAVFAIEVARGPRFTACFTSAYVLVPNDILYNTLHPPFVAHCAIHEPALVYLTLLTALFLHANALHLGGNMLYLWVFGGAVETRLGHMRYLLFYLVCGLAASAAQIAFSVYAQETTVPMLGASGAIAGVLGAYLVFFPGAKVRTVIFFGFIILTRLAAFVVIGFFIVLQLVEAALAVEAVQQSQAQASGVAFFAHIGGFIAGMFLALLIKLFGPARPSTRSTAAPRPLERASR
ncbi:MAG TPA: rhomboid family intramembrane serine protease [Ktedonobacterales bacterium]|nr:rhomboid family intramembrane serine protease [Ktedonobacterales bacterium]